MKVRLFYTLTLGLLLGMIAATANTMVERLMVHGYLLPYPQPPDRTVAVPMIVSYATVLAVLASLLVASAIVEARVKSSLPPDWRRLARMVTSLLAMAAVIAAFWTAIVVIWVAS